MLKRTTSRVKNPTIPGPLIMDDDGNSSSSFGSDLDFNAIAAILNEAELEFDDSDDPLFGSISDEVDNECSRSASPKVPPCNKEKKKTENAAIVTVADSVPKEKEDEFLYGNDENNESEETEVHAQINDELVNNDQKECATNVEDSTVVSNANKTNSEGLLSVSINKTPTPQSLTIEEKNIARKDDSSPTSPPLPSQPLQVTAPSTTNLEVEEKQKEKTSSNVSSDTTKDISNENHLSAQNKEDASVKNNQTSSNETHAVTAGEINHGTVQSEKNLIEFAVEIALALHKRQSMATEADSSVTTKSITPTNPQTTLATETNNKEVQSEKTSIDKALDIAKALRKKEPGSTEKDTTDLNLIVDISDPDEPDDLLIIEPTKQDMELTKDPTPVIKSISCPDEPDDVMIVEPKQEVIDLTDDPTPVIKVEPSTRPSNVVHNPVMTNQHTGTKTTGNKNTSVTIIADPEEGELVEVATPATPLTEERLMACLSAAMKNTVAPVETDTQLQLFSNKRVSKAFKRFEKSNEHISNMMDKVATFFMLYSKKHKHRSRKKSLRKKHKFRSYSASSSSSGSSRSKSPKVKRTKCKRHRSPTRSRSRSRQREEIPMRSSPQVTSPKVFIQEISSSNSSSGENPKESTAFQNDKPETALVKYIPSRKSNSPTPIGKRYYRKRHSSSSSNSSSSSYRKSYSRSRSPYRRRLRKPHSRSRSPSPYRNMRQRRTFRPQSPLPFKRRYSPYNPPYKNYRRRSRSFSSNSPEPRKRSRTYRSPPHDNVSSIVKSYEPLSHNNKPSTSYVAQQTIEKQEVRQGAHVITTQTVTTSFLQDLQTYRATKNASATEPPVAVREASLERLDLEVRDENGTDVTNNRPSGDLNHPFYIHPEDVELYRARIRNGNSQPVQALHEMCGKCRWNFPSYTITYGEGGVGFNIRVKLNNHEFVTKKSFARKKLAKSETVDLVLQWLKVVEIK